ncbi:MAG: hypothetical protein L6R42_002017 [Xanthoria sp. 1 TBL-2021]|nr:MAG: hypothetical protein L6R42_002017 [Xanthoria sp. 1 TBL-2021]
MLNLSMRKAEKAYFSKPEISKEVMGRSPVDFTVSFSDIQELQQLQQKLLRTSMVFSSCLEVARNLESHCEKLREFNAAKYPSAPILPGIKSYTADLKLHQQSLTIIGQTLQGTETLRIQHENSDAVKLTWQTQRDSKALKAMTTVALLFLPASLLVVSRIAPSPKIF